MTRLELQLFGVFRLLDGEGQEIPLRSAKLRALVAYLALHPDRAIKRETLAGLLWGESADAQARQSLRQALLGLRKSLGEEAAEAFAADDETVTLRSAAVRVDVAEFLAASAEGRLEEAAAAYSGDLMDEPSAGSEPFESWLAQERSRLHEQACMGLEALVEHRVEEGDSAGAVQAGRQLVALAPWRETGTRLLMRAFVLAGRRAEALQHYRGFAESLRAELDAEPDDETARLAEEIREGRGGFSAGAGPDEAASAVTAPAGEAADVALPLAARPVGRWAALAAVVLVAAVGGWALWGISERGDPDEGTVPEAAGLPATTDKPSIAVLPFVNMSGDPDQEYFADGITEDLMTALSRFGLFFVISRNSTFAYKGQAAGAKDIARDLGVHYVLQGSVRRSSDRIRVTAQLIDAVEDRQVWGESYDRALEDVFVVQDEISRQIVTAAAPEYLSAEMARAQRQEMPDLEAWDAFLRGYWHTMRFTRDDNAAAQGLLGKAIALDPKQANFHGILSVTHLMDALYGWSGSRAESLSRALEIAEHGLTLDDREALALRAAGLVHFFSKRHDEALGYFRRAVAANDHEAENRALLGAALGVAGDYQAARAEFDAALRLSPRDLHIATWYNYLAVAAFVAGRTEEAADWSKRTIQANPQFPGGYRSLAASAAELGRQPEAEAARDKLLELLPHLTVAQLRESIPYFKDPDVLERYLDGLRKAGLPEGGA